MSVIEIFALSLEASISFRVARLLPRRDVDIIQERCAFILKDEPFHAQNFDLFLENEQNKNKLRGPYSASELYRLSDRHLSTKFSDVKSVLTILRPSVHLYSDHIVFWYDVLRMLNAEFSAGGSSGLI
jgi:hypothetical protein